MLQDDVHAPGRQDERAGYGGIGGFSRGDAPVAMAAPGPGRATSLEFEDRMTFEEMLDELLSDETRGKARASDELSARKAGLGETSSVRRRKAEV